MRCLRICRRIIFLLLVFVLLELAVILDLCWKVKDHVCDTKYIETIRYIEPEVEPEPELESLGEYRITAYCSCEICCGEWALNRPNGIVYGAAGVELEAGVSCASPLPFGTVVEIEGLGEYTVQDRTAQWVVDKYGENLIDIYFDDHEAALEFGLQFKNVYLKGEV